MTSEEAGSVRIRKRHLHGPGDARAHHPTAAGRGRKVRTPWNGCVEERSVGIDVRSQQDAGPLRPQAPHPVVETAQQRV